MNSFDITLSLLRSSLWGTEVKDMNLDEGWWSEIYEISKSQGVHTLLADAFRPGCVPGKTLLARWALDVEHTEGAYRRVQSAGEELARHWNAAGLRFAILKGVSVARMYPNPSHRLFGDIDFYFPDEDDFRVANKVAARMGELKYDSDGDCHYRYKGVVVEHHNGWTHLSSRAASKLSPSMDENELSPSDNLVMLSSHILRHALVGGAGLRQLADLAVATRALHGKYDRKGLNALYAKLGLTRWAGLLAAVMADYFGVPDDELPFSPDRTYLGRFMDLVRFDGDLGKESAGLFAGFSRRFRLFTKVAPGEYYGRYVSLAFGRVRRILGFGRK